MDIALQITERYHRLWDELTAAHEFGPGETFKIGQRLERLHELGFDVEEMDIVDDVDGGRLRYIPRVVEHGFHSERLQKLTGLEATENQARRLLDDVRSFGSEMMKERQAKIEHGAPTGHGGASVRTLPENVIAVRWLDDRFEPLMATIPLRMFDKLEAAEIYHQLLEHRWFLSETSGKDVGLQEALQSYIVNVLVEAPDELNITIEAPAEEVDEAATFDGHE